MEGNGAPAPGDVPDPASLRADHETLDDRDQTLSDGEDAHELIHRADLNLLSRRAVS
jgi:hypothetical protein